MSSVPNAAMREGHAFQTLAGQMSKPPKKPTAKRPSEDELRRQHERFILRWNIGASIAKYLIVGFSAVAFAYVTFYLPVQASSGEETTITHGIKFLADINAHVYLAWGAAAATTYWGWNERKQKLSERAQKDQRIRELEKKLDPRVTSSNLDVTGDKEQELAK